MLPVTEALGTLLTALGARPGATLAEQWLEMLCAQSA